MKSKVLIITPDGAWAADALKHLDSFFEGETVVTGKEGQLKIYKTSFDYVFVHLDTVSNSGMEVIRYIHTAFPKIKIFALASGTSNVIDESALKKLGVVSIHPDLSAKDINMPITKIGAIKKWQEVQAVAPASDKEASETEIVDGRFTRIKIDELFQEEVAVFDLYLRLSLNKYIKIIHKGEMSSSGQIKKYSDSGAKYLYFLTDDRADYVSYQNALTKKDLKKENVAEGKILKNLKSVTEKFIEEVHVQGIQPQLIEEGKLLTQNMFELTQKDKSLKKIMGSLEEFNPTLFSHSFLVCFFCTVICKNLEWVGAKTLESLALGGLFHDIGLIQLPENIVTKKVDLLTDDEMILFRQHPRKSYDTLDGIPSINSSIQQTVLQHHETNNGAGFPNGLTGNKIFPLAKILGLADGFTDFIVEKECSPLDGIREFLATRDNLTRYDSELVKSLVKGFISDKKTAG